MKPSLFLHFAVLPYVASKVFHHDGVNSISYKDMPMPQFPIGENCYCTPEIRPVCGSLGPVVYSYMNECILRCAKGVDLLYDGPCCSSRMCSNFDSPVCDSENMMYRNPCSFEEAQCFSHRILGRHLSMDSSAPSCTCIESCPEEWSPVCDTNGKTHPSQCVFRNNQCFMRQQQGQHIEMVHNGACCSDVCHSPPTEASFSLCDSEGRSHPDLCSYYRAKCQAYHHSSYARITSSSSSSSPSPTPSSNLTIAHFGPCSSLSSRLSNSYINFRLLRFTSQATR